MYDKTKIKTNEELLSELLLQWEESLQAGKDVSAEILCRQYPHLTSELNEQIKRLIALEPMLATDDFAEEDTDKPDSTQQAASLPESVSTESQFHLVSHLATGGHGQVHIAKDETLGREVAIKSLRNEYAANSNNSRRLKREAEITGRLNHPGIVPIHSLGEDASGRPFYSMQLISGVTLRRAINDFHTQQDQSSGQRRLEFLKLIRHFVNVCDTIAFAHSRNVIHRDIKPENILLGEFGATFVVDWGLAIVDSENNSDQSSEGDDEFLPHDIGYVIGTPGYMSPEQLRGARAGKPSDVFNLGATLYAILTGTKPYQIKAHGQNIDTSISEITPPRKTNRSVAPALSSICMKAMNLEPDHRYSSVQAMANDVECWLADEPVSAHRETVVELASRWIRRHRQFAVAAGIVLIVAFFALATSTLLINREKNKTVAAGEIAKENYELARSAVDEMFHEFSENLLLEQPGAHELRMQLLQKSLDYYQEFLEQQTGDKQLVAEIADANERVAFIVSQIGSHDEAIGHLERAIDIREQMFHESPDAELALKFAQALSQKAEIALSLGQLPMATELISSAAELVTSTRVKQTETADSAVLQVRVMIQQAKLHFVQGEYDLAIRKNRQALQFCENSSGFPITQQLGKFPSSILANIGNSQRLAGDYDSALESYRNAVREFGRLIETNPRDTENRASMANSMIQIGSIESMRENMESARQALEQGIAVLQEVTDLESNVHDYQRMLADAQTELGRLLIDADTTRARRLLISAAEIRSQLVAANPKDIGLSFNSAAASCGLAKLEMASRRFDVATEYFENAIEIFRDLDTRVPNDPQIRVRGLACTLQALGEAQQADGDYQNAVATRRESIGIFQRRHASDPSVETELKLTQLSLELSESLHATGAHDESLSVLQDRATELARSLVINGPLNAERRQLGNEIDKLAKTLLHRYQGQQGLASETLKIRERLEGQGNQNPVTEPSN